MDKRKAVTLGLTLIAASLFAQSQQTGIHETDHPKPGFSILVTVSSQSQPRLTEPISVTITVTNETNHTIGWESSYTTDPHDACAAFRYDLQRNGKEVETTLFHRQIDLSRLRRDDPIAPGRLRADSILTLNPPGKMFEIKVDLKRLYQISEPGNYALQVSRYDSVTKTTVRSNTLMLDIKP